MERVRRYSFLICVFFSFSLWAGKGPNVTLAPEEIQGFDQLSKPVQEVLTLSLGLTTQHLDYVYGSADPKKGGMDCSGAVYYVLTQAGLENVPRSSSEQYRWVRKAGLFHTVNSTAQDTFELEELKPGDLMFWVGTYDIKRDPPITHVMFYLGRLKKDNQRVMVGASDGRTYDNIQRFGVSVFDFNLPGFPVPSRAQQSNSRFIGYGSVPGLAKE
jgi:cell wall-associated NlpC family hydrolase